MEHTRITDATTVEDLVDEGWSENDARKLLDLWASLKVAPPSDLPQMPPSGPRQIPPHIPSTEYRHQPTDPPPQEET